MLLLILYYDFVILALKQNFNTALLFILCYLYIFTNEYVKKELLINAMFRSKKRQRIEKVPKGVSIRTWLMSVQEAGHDLEKI